MTEFTASNGVRVSPSEIASDGLATYLDDSTWVGRVTIGPRHSQALREFYQHERDEALGRWRYPENTDVVVYEYEAWPNRQALRVVYERNGEALSFITPDEIPRDSTFWAHQAALAYLDANAAKPWQDAKTGEFWALTRNGHELLYEVVNVVDGRPRFQCTEPDPYVEAQDPFTAGRRIWPEETE